MGTNKFTGKSIFKTFFNTNAMIHLSWVQRDIHKTHLNTELNWQNWKRMKEITLTADFEVDAFDAAGFLSAGLAAAGFFSAGLAAAGFFSAGFLAGAAFLVSFFSDDVEAAGAAFFSPKI